MNRFKGFSVQKYERFSPRVPENARRQLERDPRKAERVKEYEHRRHGRAGGLNAVEDARKRVGKSAVDRVDREASVPPAFLKFRS